MSIIAPVPRDQLRKNYQHRGWFLGLVPVYIGDAKTDCPLVVERNGVPSVFFWIALALFASFCWIAGLVNPLFEPVFPIAFTGRLDGGKLLRPDGELR